MMTIPGYTLIAPVSEDGDLMLYRATRMLDGLPVLLKVSAGLPPLILSQLEHEYELARDLDPDRIARPLALERHGSKVALVLKQGPTNTLASLLGSPMDVQSFLRIAIGMNAALAELQCHELVHKNLKPEHVLLDAAGHVWLTGLGIASRLPRERQTPEPPEAITGTLAYMAPEQTGRMNRSIDSRSDLYALGINFYQMLTGELPFTAGDPMEWVHCHIARQPIPPSERVAKLPEPLSAIVMKLLAKTAEERYQSAAGLDADLCHCLAEWESNGRIAAYAIGAHDIPDRLLVPEKLYGRKSEIETLLAAFERVVDSGNAELVLVSGYSGIGKTSVVYELHKALVPPRGLFAAGKFDQYRRDIPYATLVQALQSLVRHILGKSEAEVEGWRDALQKAVSPNGQLIISLIPEVELIIGEQPPVPDLPPQEARNRFRMVLLRFIGVFAKPEHPLALFLDDLQWLDAATLDLINHLTTESDVGSLLLVGAYRDNEVTPTHPLMQTLETIRKGEARVQDIVLAPLTVNDVCCLIADSLRCNQERALPLAQLLHEKTAGNPFFVIQFLTTLAEEKLLVFDPDARRWTWDLARIHAKGFADNVVDLMVEKLGRLPETTRESLKQFSCLGNVAKITTLRMVYGQSEEALHTALWEAVAAGLIFRMEDTYAFLHDRVQEAAYALVPEASRAEEHLRIGRLLLVHSPEGKREEAIFEIVNQLNRGSALIAAEAEREELAALNLTAGKRAKASTAYAAALSYLATGKALLAEDCWERQHELAFSLDMNRAECEFLTGEFTAAEDSLAALSKRAAGVLQQAAIVCLRMDLYTTLGQSGRAIEVGLDFLRVVSIDWQPHPPEEDAQHEYERIWPKLDNLSDEDLLHQPLMSDPTSLVTLDVLTKIAPPAVFTDPHLFCLTVCRAVNLSLEQGISHGSSFAYVTLGMIAGPRFGDYKAGFRFGRLGYDLVEQRGLRRFQPLVYLVFGHMVTPWARHIRTGRELLLRCFEAANKIGDLTFAAYSCDNLIANLLVSGDPLAEVQQEAENRLAFVQKVQFAFVGDTIIGQLALIRTLRGLTREFGCFDDAQLEETQFEQHLSSNPDLAFPHCRYWIRKMQARFMAGDYSDAIESLEKAQPLIWSMASYTDEADYHFYAALSLAAHGDPGLASEWQQHLEAIAAHHQQLEIWAKHCPENFETRAALVGAEIARIEGRDLEAMRLYEQALHSAQENDFVHQEALAAEVASRFYEARGFERIAETYLRDAHTGYAHWGAEGKVRQLERLYPWLAHSQPTLAEQLDAEAVAKAQRAISGQIQLDRLAQTLLRIVMESAGAQTGYLSVEGAGQLRAEMQPDNDGIQRIVFDASPQAEAIPEAIVNYVRRCRDAVILDDAGTETGEFSADSYLRRIKPKSVLCMAIQRQEKLFAVLYLENNLVTCAFTPELRFVLEVLAAQAAISLETSAVYESLQESEERYRSLIRKVQTAIVLHDGQGQLLDCNPLANELLGLSRDQLRGKSLIDPEWHFLREDGTIMPVAEYPASIVLSSQRALKGYVAGICRPNVEEISWVLVNAEPEYSSTGEISLIIVSFMDITDRKQAEDNIEWNLTINQALSSLYIPLVTAGTSIEQIAEIVLEKSRQLTGSAHGYVAEIDPVTGDLIAHTNTKMIQTECKVADEELRKTRFPQRTDGLYNGLWGHALNTKEPFYTDEPVKHPAAVGIPEGHLAIESFLAVPVLLAGELVGQIALSNSSRAYSERDLDAINRIADYYALAIQHKRAEEEIRQLNQGLEQRVIERTTKLEAANKDLEAFAYSVSHDLRAPLRHIDGFLELLQKKAGTALDEQSRHYLGSISDATNKMGLLIDDLLSFSKTGRQAMSFRSVELGPLVHEIIRDLAPDTVGRNIEWRIGDLPLVRGDAAMMRIVLNNLISNALKFTRLRQLAEIEIGSLPDQGSQIVVFVRDNGVGFDMAYVDKLFNVFQRLHHVDEFEGTGIGLAIVRLIVTRHGGSAWTEGDVDQGATFCFSLPRPDPAKKYSREHTHAPTDRQGYPE